MKPSYFIQYHNADQSGQYPYQIADFRKRIDSLNLEDSVTYRSQFDTSKKQVEKAVGQFCFLIVGKTEGTKRYYLWSYFKIEDYEKDASGLYDVKGTGFNLKNPVLLNELEHFQDFKRTCGNFGLGFQNVSNQIFCQTLIALVAQSSPKRTNLNRSNTKDNLLFTLQRLSKEMEKVKPSKRSAEVEQILRRDGRIVQLLKKAANYRCQFPDCNSEIPTKKGLNYVEVAHIKPVYKGGQSIIGNLIVLCPNHHKEFDYGALKIKKQTDTRLVGLLNGKAFTINQVV